MIRPGILVLLLFLGGCASSGEARADRDALLALVDPEQAGVRDEYGWICEYSTVGFEPPQRQATVRLVGRGRVDLLRDALAGPNLQGRVYAADALLYLASEGVDLTASDRAAIEALRASDAVVRTCGNSGSYRIYPGRARDVLSDSALADLRDQYRWLLERAGMGQ